MRRSARRPGSRSCLPGSCEQGSAVVDFVLVGGLLTMFFLAIIQLTLILHVRNTLIDAAASGARYGTLADRGAADAVERTRSLIGTALNAGFAEQVSTREVDVRGFRTLEVRGHAAVQP